MAFPRLPLSLRSRPVGTREALAPEDQERDLPSVRTGGQPAPFLGLRSRLSQIWLNRWTILLLLVLVRVIILLTGLNENIGDAKVRALSACSKVEDIGSAMASMPHYLSRGVNKVASEGISHAISGMVQVLMLILTAVENIIYFVINFYVGTYVCLIAAFIHGTFDIGVGAADAVTKVMNDAIGKISNGLNDEIGKFQNTVNDIIDKVNSGTSLGGLIGGSGISIPKLDVGSKLNDLRNIKVDSGDFVKSLKDMKEKTPTFDDVQNFTKEAIAVPFDLVRKELNKSASTWGAPRDMFPLAQKQALSFCSDNTAIRDFFDGLYTVANNARIAFLVVIPLLAVLVCIPMAIMEIRRYRRQKALSRQMINREFDSMDVIYQASRPSSSRIGVWLGNKFKGSDREYLVRWAWAYATSLPALFVLSLAIAGLFSCFCQWIVLQLVKKEAPALVNKVGDFANDVVRTLEGVSTKWATDANGVMIKFNDEVNNDVLGHVRTATSAVNNTLTTFQSEMNKRLDQVFKGTVLENVVKDVVRCIIGLKIEAVEKGLTWVHEHAKVSFPLFPNDTFSNGAQASISGDSDMTSFLSSPSSVTTDEITAAVYRVVNYLQNGIVQDALVSAGLLLLYVIVVLVGVIRALLNITGPRKSTRGMGGGLQHHYTGGAGAAAHNEKEDMATRGSSSQGGAPLYAPHDERREYDYAATHEMKQHPVSTATQPAVGRHQSSRAVFVGSADADDDDNDYPSEKKKEAPPPGSRGNYYGQPF